MVPSNQVLFSFAHVSSGTRSGSLLPRVKDPFLATVVLWGGKWWGGLVGWLVFVRAQTSVPSVNFSR